MNWEYKTIKMQASSFLTGDKPSYESAGIDNFINELGRQGWELVSTQLLIFNLEFPDTNAVVLFFKRPLAE